MPKLAGSEDNSYYIKDKDYGIITNDAGIREDEGAVQGLRPHVPCRGLL